MRSRCCSGRNAGFDTFLRRSDRPVPVDRWIRRCWPWRATMPCVVRRSDRGRATSVISLRCRQFYLMGQSVMSGEERPSRASCSDDQLEQRAKRSRSDSSAAVDLLRRLLLVPCWCLDGGVHRNQRAEKCSASQNVERSRTRRDYLTTDRPDVMPNARHPLETVLILRSRTCDRRRPAVEAMILIGSVEEQGHRSTRDCLLPADTGRGANCSTEKLGPAHRHGGRDDD